MSKTIWAGYIQHGGINFGPVVVLKETGALWNVEASPLTEYRRQVRKDDRRFHEMEGQAIAAIRKEADAMLDRASRLAFKAAALSQKAGDA